MRRRLGLLIAAALVLSPVTAARGDHSDGRGSLVEENLRDCGHEPAHEAALSGTLDWGRRVDLELLVIVDRVTDRRASEDIVSHAAAPFARHRLVLSPTYFVRDLEGDDTRDLLEQARRIAAELNGPSYDAIAVLTGVDVVTAGRDSDGASYCTAGVRFRSSLRSVFVSETQVGRKRLPNRTPSVQLRRTAFSFAHALGHLLGGRDEHANCVEALGTEDVTFNDEWIQPCTLMEDTLPGDLRLSTLEASVMRGHALRFADS
jgi:hypothetical protein